ncbi:MAG TPA: Fic family protein [bacterium]|nr:Fic family protein [bacterium]
MLDLEFAFWMRAWTSRRSELERHKELAEFVVRLKREWAVETGMIEQLYSWPHGVTESLVEHGFRMDILESHGVTHDPEQVKGLLDSQLAALDIVMDFIGSRRALSEADISDLHLVLTEHQLTAPGRDPQGRRVEIELIRGRYKQWPNNPIRADGLIHEYCPPEQVKPEMERLLALHAQHMELGVPPDVEAAWLHHRFVQIHPFQDGNGRLARCLATMVILKGGGFPLVVRSVSKPLYLSALGAADQGDLRPFVRYLAEQQISDLKQAMELQGRLEKGALEEVLQVGVELLAEVVDLPKARGTVEETARAVAYEIRQEISKVLSRLERTITQAGEYKFELTHSGQFDPKLGLDETALSMGGVGRPAAELFYRRETLFLRSGFSKSVISFSILAADDDYRGALQVVGHYRVGYTGRGHTLLREDAPERRALSAAPFTFSFRESTDAVKSNLQSWLGEALASGLSIWFQQERRFLDLSEAPRRSGR